MTADKFRIAMGSETEWSVSGSMPGCERRVTPELACDLLLTAVRRVLPHLPDRSVNGMFLPNGGRLYNEIHGHPEYATPEVRSPAELAAYDKAGELILRRAMQEAAREHRIDFVITKHNIGSVHPDQVSFGSHESHLCWISLPRLATPLIPHLVSRTIYAGAGCLSAHERGLGFELSQRARHMLRPVGPETTHDRAIFCTRVRKRSDAEPNQWTRLHLISKDSQRAPFGSYLTFGTTALVIQLVQYGCQVGRKLALLDPVAALRTISLDPWLKAKVPLADGRHLSALEIQEQYLADCERPAQRINLPDWGRQVLEHWRQTLSDLARSPLRLATKLDPYIKLAVYEHLLRQASCSFGEFQRGLQLLAELHQNVPTEVVQSLVDENAGSLPKEFRPALELAQVRVRAAGPGAADRLRLALRLRALDLNYHQLGGLYDQLDEANQVQKVVLTAAEIERAVETPPADTRAAIRGAHVRDHSGEAGWACDWAWMMHGPSQTAIDLRDPFESAARTVPAAALA